MEEKLDSSNKRIHKTEKMCTVLKNRLSLLTHSTMQLANRAKLKSVEFEVSDVKQDNKELRKAILEMKKK